VSVELYQNLIDGRRAPSVERVVPPDSFQPRSLRQASPFVLRWEQDYEMIGGYSAENHTSFW
jgi:hypothetical protein